MNDTFWDIILLVSFWKENYWFQKEEFKTLHKTQQTEEDCSLDVKHIEEIDLSYLLSLSYISITMRSSALESVLHRSSTRPATNVSTNGKKNMSLIIIRKVTILHSNVNMAKKLTISKSMLPMSMQLLLDKRCGSNTFLELGKNGSTHFARLLILFFHSAMHTNCPIRF